MPADFKAQQTWSYTYDAKGNKRKNYTYQDDVAAAETPSSKQNNYTSSTTAKNRSSGPGAGTFNSQRRTGTSPGSSFNQRHGFSTAAYGKQNIDSDNDALWKFGLGTFGIISVLGLLTAGMNLSDSEKKGKRYANSSRGGHMML